MIIHPLRTKEELINHFEERGQSITEEEIWQLKKSYEQVQEKDGALTLEQLDDVAGGTLRVYRFIMEGKLSDSKVCQSLLTTESKITGGHLSGGYRIYYAPCSIFNLEETQGKTEVLAFHNSKDGKKDIQLIDLEETGKTFKGFIGLQDLETCEQEHHIIPHNFTFNPDYKITESYLKLIRNLANVVADHNAIHWSLWRKNYANNFTDTITMQCLGESKHGYEICITNEENSIRNYGHYDDDVDIPLGEKTLSVYMVKTETPCVHIIGSFDNPIQTVNPSGKGHRYNMSELITPQDLETFKDNSSPLNAEEIGKVLAEFCNISLFFRDTYDKSAEIDSIFNEYGLTFNNPNYVKLLLQLPYCKFFPGRSYAPFDKLRLEDPNFNESLEEAYKAYIEEEREFAE